MSFADLYISILTEPSTLKVGKYGKVIIQCGNTGQSIIVPNSVRIILSGSNNGRITSLVANKKWRKVYLGAQKTSNTIVLTNKAGLGVFDVENIYVRIRGVKVGEASTLTANISYITANNPLLPGNGLNASQGNMNNTNDNSTTSLTVTAK